MPARILLVDDHAIVRHGLALLVEQEEGLTVCGEAGNVGEALDAAAKLQPDLAIVDIALEGADGVELIKQLRSRWPDLSLLALSMHSEALYAERSLRAGASGYLKKDDAPEHFVLAIRKILDGGVYLSESFAGQFLRRVVGGERGDDRMPTEDLTDRELAVLRLIGAGHTTRKISEELNLSIKTVQSHQEHIKRKLDVATATELVRYATLWMEGESGG